LLGPCAEACDGPPGTPVTNVAKSFVSREAKNRGTVGAEIETLSKKNSPERGLRSSPDLDPDLG